MANDALYFVKDRMALREAKGKIRLKDGPIVMKVYTGYRSYRYVGKCYTRVGVICLNEKRNITSVLETLAHEIAHMAWAAHGPRHAETTKKIYMYLLKWEAPK